MSQADVIREFLVSLGFKTDETSLKRFKGGIDDATKKVASLAAVTAGAALAVGVAVQRFASNMETLYFASQRTGASVKGIKAVQFAARQLGSSSEDAMASVESLARFMRSSPVTGGFIKDMLGVDTRDASGGLRDTADVLVDIGKALGAMPVYRANGIASVLGIDERMMLAIRSGDFERFAKQYKDLANNTDFEGAARKAHAFQERLREIGDRADAAGAVVGEKLLDVLGPQMEKAAKWFEDNADDIAKVVSGIGSAIVTAGEIAVPVLSRIAEGWKKIFEWAEAAGKAMGDALPQNERDNIGRNTAKFLAFFGNKEAQAALDAEARADASQRTSSGRMPGVSPYTPAAGNQPRGIRNNNPGNLNYAGQAGATKEGGPGGRFAVFGSAQAGLNALANQLDLYRQRGINSVSSIIGKYAPASENNTQAYIASLSKSLGVGAGDKLDLTNPAVMAKMMDAIIRVENGRNPYGQDMLTSAARGTKGTQMSQQTNIYVTGNGASETGRAVAGEQDRVNSRLARNLAGASS